MYQCSHCKAEVPEGAQFCSSCGQVLESAEASAESLTTAQDQDEDTLALRSVVVTPSAPLADEHSSTSIDNAESSPEAQPEAETLLLSPQEQPAPTPELEVPLVDTSEDNNPPPTEVTAQAQEDEEPATLIIEQEQAGEEEESVPAAELDEGPQSADGQRAEPVRSKRPDRGWVVAVVVLVVLLVLGGGAGAFVLHLQLSSQKNAQVATVCSTGCPSETPAGDNGAATHLTFSGAVSGPMTLNASPACQSLAVSKLSTLSITLTGAVGGQTYNFGFVIEDYHGAGTYSETAASVSILLNTPGESTTNGWSNVSTSTPGTITITSGGQKGTLTTTLSGFGSQANTQVKISGNWLCG